MFKIIITVQKKEAFLLMKFIQYYENHHVPLLRRILPPINIYRRNYIVPNDPLTNPENAMEAKGEEIAAEFHVFTETIYSTREEAQAFLNAFYAPENMKIISGDESKFVEPGGVKAYVVEVYQSSIP